MAEPTIRFKRADGSNYPPIEPKSLNEYLTINPDRNKERKYDKADVLSVSGDFGVVNQIEFQGRSFAGADVKDYHILYHGDVVYTKSPLKENPFGIVKFNDGPTGIVSTLYAVYHCKDNVDGRIIEYYFDLKSRINNYLKPLVNIGAKHDMKISAEKAISAHVMLPCLEEQQKIADFLSSVDEILSSSEQEVVNLEKQKKAVMKKIFSQEVRFKREDGTDFPKWEKVKFWDAVEINSSLVDPTIEPYRNMLHVGAANIEKNTGALLPCMSAASEGITSGKYLFDETCVVYSKIRPELSKATIPGFVGLCSADAYPLKPRDGILPEIILMQLLSDKFVKFATSTSARTKMPKINQEELGGYMFVIPCFEEQRLIADFLSDFNEAVAAAKKELELWKELKKGLLQQMFV